MNTLRVLSAGLLVLISLGVGAPAAAQAIDPVHLYDRQSLTSGNGARFQVRSGCVTVTAGHVVANTSYPEITPERQSVDTANVAVLAERLDVAIIRQDHVDRSRCGALPTLEKIEEALRTGGEREIRLVNAGGALTNISVELIRYDGWDIFLRIKPGQEITSFQPGNSGAVVVFDGVPVGVITDGFTGLGTAEAKAIRLDAVIRTYSDLLSFPSTSTGANITASGAFEPYDTSWMPSEFEEAIQRIRAATKRAEDAAERAEREAVLAVSGSMMAVPLSSVERPKANTFYSWISNTGTVETRGMVYKKGPAEEPGRAIYASQGLGVTRIVAGEGIGRVMKGRFVKSVLRTGVSLFDVTPSRPDGSTRRIGEWNDQGLFQLGISEWSDGQKWIGTFNGGRKPNLVTNIKADGRRFEGRYEAGSNWSVGYCAWWSPEGEYEEGGVCSKDGGYVEVISPP